YLNFVFTIAGEGIGKHRATARAHGKPLDVLLLRKVRPNTKSVAAWRTVWCADRQAADLLRGRDVAIQKRRRKISDRHIVEAMTHIVLRQQRCGIDVQCQ